MRRKRGVRPRPQAPTARLSRVVQSRACIRPLGTAISQGRLSRLAGASRCYLTTGITLSFRTIVLITHTDADACFPTRTKTEPTPARLLVQYWLLEKGGKHVRSHSSHPSIIFSLERLQRHAPPDRPPPPLFVLESFVNVTPKTCCQICDWINVTNSLIQHAWVSPLGLGLGPAVRHRQWF